MKLANHEHPTTADVEHCFYGEGLWRLGFSPLFHCTPSRLASLTARSSKYWENATQLWQSHEGRRSMVATINMADMAVGKEPRYQWDRCTCASWQYKPEHQPCLAFSEPDALPIEAYSKLYQAMQVACAARF